MRKIEDKIFRFLDQSDNSENKHTFFETVKLFKNEFIQQAEANEITLYQSILENNGPKYFPVYTVKLNNSGEHKS